MFDCAAFAFRGQPLYTYVKDEVALDPIHPSSTCFPACLPRHLILQSPYGTSSTHAKQRFHQEPAHLITSLTLLHCAACAGPCVALHIDLPLFDIREPTSEHSLFGHSSCLARLRPSSFIIFNCNEIKQRLITPHDVCVALIALFVPCPWDTDQYHPPVIPNLQSPPASPDFRLNFIRFLC